MMDGTKLVDLDLLVNPPCITFLFLWKIAVFKVIKHGMKHIFIIMNKRFNIMKSVIHFKYLKYIMRCI